MRRRLLARAIERAKVRLEDDGDELVPATLTPHGLGHTFASLLCAVGENPRHVMGRLGHADAKFTLRAYAKGDGPPRPRARASAGRREGRAARPERVMELPLVPDPEGR